MAALTTDDLTTISTCQGIINTLVPILDKETTIASENRSANGVSDANVANINTTIQNALSAMDAILSGL